SFIPAPHDHAFDWDRPLKASAFSGRNIFTESGATNVLEGLEALLFPAQPAVISISGHKTFQWGVTQDFTITGTLRPNDQNDIASIQVLDENDLPLKTIVPNDYPANTPIEYEVVNLIHSTKFRIKATTDGGAEIFSPWTEVNFIVPHLYGFNAHPDLQGYNAYKNLSTGLFTDNKVAIAYAGTNGYMYFFRPKESGPLSAIRDSNNFGLGTFLKSETLVEVTSDGLDSNFNVQFYRYRSPFQSKSNTTITFTTE
ncbi:MAG TPA: hypothetical protein DIU20_09305, partial [Cryomorphaceae bacterium]|nr:hypothetical protein [Cryomorphaceae bacterium]